MEACAALPILVHSSTQGANTSAALLEWLCCLLLLKLRGYQMESGRAYCISGGYSEGRLGSVPSY